MAGISDFQTIEGITEGELVLKGSRFIGICMPCTEESQIRTNLDAVEAKYRDATHYCWAAVFNGSSRRERSSDNGEPSGTAGKPILAVVKGTGLTDLMVVVVRYFGGTLLGTGGLVHAYTEGAKIAVRDVRRVTRRACCSYMFHLGYPDYSAFESKMSDLMAVRPKCEYSERVDVRVWVPVDRRDEFLRRLSDLTERRAVPTELPDEYVRPSPGIGRIGALLCPGDPRAWGQRIPEGHAFDVPKIFSNRSLNKIHSKSDLE